MIGQWIFIPLCGYYYFGLVQECMGKENEDRKAVKFTSDHDEIPLFYTDIMPLLVRVSLSDHLSANVPTKH